MDFNNLDQLISQGFLKKVVSPCGKLVLYNYTPKCVFEKEWNEHTINARGTIYELSTGKIIAQAFPKFFNFSELPTERQKELLNETNFDVFEKIDGSLVIVYNYDNNWRINTRGSFGSDQAVEATKMLEGYKIQRIPNDITLLCEVVYPENRIIIDYGNERKLVLLAAYNIQNNTECTYDTLQYLGSVAEMEVAKKYNFKNIEQLIEKQNVMTNKEEGFVVRFDNGYRIKFKSLEYLKTVRAVMHITPLGFWECMKNGIVDREMLHWSPEEFKPEVDKIVNSLETSYKFIKDRILEECNAIISEANKHENPKKYIGLRVSDLLYGKAAFFILNENYDSLDKYIMKMIRPTGNIYP